MSRLDELIAKLCPNGVKYFTLNECFDQFSGMGGVTNKWADAGNCQFVDYMNAYNHIAVDVQDLPFATVKNLNQTVLRQGDVLFTSASETPDECAISSLIEDEIKDGIFLDDHLFGLRVKKQFSDNIFMSFLKYVFRTNNFRQQVKKAVRGVTRFYVSKQDFMNLVIPVPPLEVQREIVRVLDNFKDFTNNLTDKLTAELAARRTQLSYYREQLIKTSSNIKEKLSDVVDIYLGLTATPNYVESGVKFISAQNTSSDYLDLDNVKYISFDDYKKATKNAKPKRGDLLFTRVGSNLGHPIIVDTDEDLCIFVSLGFLRIKNERELIVDYLKHWMNTNLFWDQVKKNVHGAAKVNLNTGWLKDFLIPLPNYEFQQSIISELNRLEILCTSMVLSLSAEITARQKQYEYYRDKLLTFKELNA